METLLIHDLTPKQLSAVLPDTSGYTIIDANRSAAFCQGCFRCWLASPGRCEMTPSLQTVSAQIGNAEAVIVLLNVSPKSRGSASAFYTSLLRLFLTGCEVQVCQLRRAGDHENVFALLPWADAVVISAPLYVDAAPAHVAAFLEQAQQRCKETPCRFTLYAISNCGFPDGHQNELHLRIYEA